MRYLLIVGSLFFAICNVTLSQDGYEQIRQDQVRTVSGKQYYVHQVKKGQTLYSISKAYDVSMEEIIAANPEIKLGLKANQTLLIPSPGQEPLPELTPLPDVSEQDSLGTDLNDLPGEEPALNELRNPLVHIPCTVEPGSGEEVYNIALLIHLFLNEQDVRETELRAQQRTDTYKSFRYIQFYEGLLLAVDSLSKTGMKLNLYVYSLETNPSAVGELLKKPELEKMNLIIGMIFNSQFEVVASWARDHQIPIVSPVSERESQVNGNPMVIKIRPSATSEQVAVSGYLAEHCRSDHIVLIRSWEEDVKKMADQLYASCQAQGLNITPGSQDAVMKTLSRKAENVVVVCSREKSFVMNVLSQLNANTTGYRFTVVGLPRWDQFEGMDYQYMENAKGHLFVPSWIDYSDPAVKRFVLRFREDYKTEPESLAFQGYDVAWYFLNALKYFGAGFINCLSEIRFKALQTTYRFQQYDGNGWENDNWKLLYYDNYTLTPLP